MADMPYFGSGFIIFVFCVTDCFILCTKQPVGEIFHIQNKVSVKMLFIVHIFL